jgi:hypothetical protein
VKKNIKPCTLSEVRAALRWPQLRQQITDAIHRQTATAIVYMAVGRRVSRLEATLTPEDPYRQIDVRCRLAWLPESAWHGDPSPWSRCAVVQQLMPVAVASSVADPLNRDLADERRVLAMAARLHEGGKGDPTALIAAAKRDAAWILATNAGAWRRLENAFIEGNFRPLGPRRIREAVGKVVKFDAAMRAAAAA